MGIGSILSELIDKKGANVNRVAQEASISPQTLYSMIRRDSMKVDIEVLIRVCRVLDVPVEYVYNKYKGKEATAPPSFSAHEIELITKYRTLDENGRELVESVLDTVYAQRTNSVADTSEKTTAS